MVCAVEVEYILDQKCKFLTIFKAIFLLSVNWPLFELPQKSYELGITDGPELLKHKKITLTLKSSFSFGYLGSYSKFCQIALHIIQK